MRDRETIDSELRRIALARQSISEHGRRLSSQEIDALLDERLGHPVEASVATAVKARDTDFVPDAWTRPSKIRATPRRRSRMPRRLALLAALPLSLVAIVVAVVLMLSSKHPDPSEQTTETSPSAAPPPNRVAPKPPVPRDIVDAAFVATLKQEGVPVPSQEYVTTKGHAVCDFLAHQRNFDDAVAFVQRSSIWDAKQSTDVTAGAIVSYCPQSQPSAADELQPAYQNTLSDLQAIEGKLKGIEGDLQGIQGHLDGVLPGRP